MRRCVLGSSLNPSGFKSGGILAKPARLTEI
jgi:hypothetical protein